MGTNSPPQPKLTILLVFLTIWSSSTTILLGSNLPIAKPGCSDTCGNIKIPFPFGTNENCSLSAEFEVTCNDTTSDLVLGNIPVTNISLEGQLRISYIISHTCFNRTGGVTANIEAAITLSSARSFNFNSTSNVFIVVGCDGYPYFTGLRNGNHSFSTGCISFCSSKEELSNDGICSGAGCCQAKIPAGISNLATSVSPLDHYSYMEGINNCVYASIVEETSFYFSSEKIIKRWDSDSLPAVLDWAVVDKENNTCVKAQSSADYACKSNTDCQDNDNPTGYRCHCKQGYQGNPYLDTPGACTDINECEGNNNNDCKQNSVCENTPGNYTCNCKPGYQGDGLLDDCKAIDECTEGIRDCTIKHTYCKHTDGRFTCECKIGYKKIDDAGNCKRDEQLFYQLLAGTSVSSVFILLVSTCLYFIIRKRKSIKRKEMMREKFFKDNGGILLMEKFSKQQGDRAAKIYLEDELERATDNFAESRILGQGGYGIVFKGYLKGMTDEEHQEIAVKKSKQMDKSQMETFANEVFVLSQINHTNVVRLLGCCLDTESPLLVYEFINNGTLSEHIHDSTKASFLSLEIRLKIATETAEVLSYLHSAASPPIIHRDIKSANILLDTNYTSKVSDFGVSRLFPLDETQLPTVVLGTFGYLDPEYMQTGKLTVKSDVYSFGILLMEIMAGKKVVYFDSQGEETRLAKHFLSCLDENRLSDILDVNLPVQEGNFDCLIEMALVARRCISIRGEDRPSMREVATKLRGILDQMKQLDFQAKPSGTRKMESVLLEPSMVYGLDGISITIDGGGMSNLRQLDIGDGR